MKYCLESIIGFFFRLFLANKIDTYNHINRIPNEKFELDIIGHRTVNSSFERRLKIFSIIFLSLILSRNILPQNDSTDIYDLSLMQLSNLKITSAIKASQSLDETPSTIYIITESDIKEKGYFTLEEALSELPGFQFRNILGINSYIFQRGIPNQNNLTLLLIDGVQINELNSGGFYAGAQYNLLGVERIEVIYGPVSITYGTNAISGIINIVTKNPPENKINSNVQGGSFNTSKFAANYFFTNKNDSFGISASGMFNNSAKADLKNNEGDFNWTDKMDNFERNYSLDLKINYGDFIFGTNYFLKQSSTATMFKSVGTSYKDYGTSWNIQFINNYLKYYHRFSDNLTSSSILYNRNTTVLDNTVYYILDSTQVGYYRPNNLTGFENVLNYKPLELFSLTCGLTIEFEQLAKKNSSSFSNSPLVKPPPPEKPEMVDNKLLSIFIEPRMKLYSDLYLSAGLRFDNSSIYDQVLTPQFGLNYHFSNYIFRLSYAEAFRAPKPWDYTDGLGNASLLPEKMKSIESAITLSFSNNYKIDLVGYKNVLSGAIIKEFVKYNYRWINGSQVTTEGLELFFRYESKELKAAINYTFTQSIDEYDLSLPEISKHIGNMSLTYSIGKHVTINVRANYIGARDNPKIISSVGTKKVEPSLIFHTAISLLNFSGFDSQLIVKNIFNTEYYHTSNREPDRYRQPQRTILISLGYNFNY